MMSLDDVPCKVGEHHAPVGRIVPDAGPEADMLSLLGNPDAKQLEGGFVALGHGRDVEELVRRHWLLRGADPLGVPLRLS